MLDVLRGGVPAPTRVPLGDLSGASLTASYDLNNAYVPRYDPHFLNFWKITKEQLSIFIGIELFYGNYSEYMLVYVARLHEKLAKLLKLHSQVQQLPKEAEKAVLAGGIQAMEATMARYKEVSDEFNSLQNYISENILSIADEIGFDSDDLLELLSPYLSDSQQKK